jgi:hypothetical protein
MLAIELLDTASKNRVRRTPMHARDIIVHLVAL